MQIKEGERSSLLFQQTLDNAAIDFEKQKLIGLTNSESCAMIMSPAVWILSDTKVDIDLSPFQKLHEGFIGKTGYFIGFRK